MTEIKICHLRLRLLFLTFTSIHSYLYLCTVASVDAFIKLKATGMSKSNDILKLIFAELREINSGPSAVIR